MIIKDFMALRKTEGEIGVEIEYEGRNLPLYPDKWWRVTGDGSLRGNAAEFVFDGPLPQNKVPTAISYLKKMFEDNGYNPNNMPTSDRCGVHVHINCQQMSVREVFNFIILYLIFEDLLVKWCGKTREGNLFCMRARDAESFVSSMRKSIQETTFDPMYGDEFRYASINVGSLFKYGSLEFRAMRTPDNFDEICNWVDILCRLKRVSQDFKEPVEFVGALSGNPDRFISTVLGPYIELIETPDAEEMMFTCIRRLQPIIYAFDMAEYEKAAKKWDDRYKDAEKKRIEAKLLKKARVRRDFE